MYYTLKRNTILVILLVCATFSLLPAENYNKTFTNDDDVCTSIPYLQCPSFVWLKPIESQDPSRTGTAVAEPGGPDCGEPIVTYYDDVFIINSCHLVITRVWTATDPNNPALFDTCHQTIKVVDEEAPVISNPPEDIMIYNNLVGCKQNVFWDYPDIYDNSALDYIEYIATYNGQTFEVNNGDIFHEGLTEITLTAYDFCGNISSHKFNINIMCAQCHVSCPDDACLPVGSDISPDAIGYASSYSGNMNCGSADIDFYDIIMETGCNGKMKYMRVWEAEFGNLPGFVYNCTQIIELKNDTEISLTNCPSDIVIDNNFVPVHWEEPFASNGNQIVMLTSNYQPGNTFPVGITTVIYTATDLCGNEATCSFKISVLNDNSFDDCPDDIILNCGSDGVVLVDWDPPVYDGACSSCTHSGQIPGFVNIGSLGSSVYYCSSHFYTFEEAQERANKLGGHIVSIGSQEENEFVASHIGTQSAIIGLSDYRNEGTMVWESNEPLDYSKWFVNQPNDRDGIQDYVEILKNSGEWNDYDNGLSKEFVLEMPCQYVTQISGPKPGTLLGPGEYKVVYKIADGCGFEKYCEFHIIIEGGLSVISCPTDITVTGSLTEPGVSVTWNEPQFSTCCQSCITTDCITILKAGPDQGFMFPNDTKSLVGYTASDDCGNTIQCSFNVTVEPPTGNMVVEADPRYSIGFEKVETTIDERFIVTKRDRSKRIKVFPNPVKDVVTISIDDPETVQSVSILSLDGMHVQTINETLNQLNSIHVQNLNNGIYLINIQFEDGTQQVERLIKF